MKKLKKSIGKPCIKKDGISTKERRANALKAMNAPESGTSGDTSMTYNRLLSMANFKYMMLKAEKHPDAAPQHFTIESNQVKAALYVMVLEINCLINDMRCKTSGVPHGKENG